MIKTYGQKSISLFSCPSNDNKIVTLTRTVWAHYTGCILIFDIILPSAAYIIWMLTSAVLTNSAIRFFLCIVSYII